MTLKHFLKHQNRSKNKIRKITVKSRNDVKSACFLHVLCHISAIFEDIDLKFCTHIHQPLPTNILSGFLKISILRGKILEKKKKLLKILKIWRNFQNFQNAGHVCRHSGCRDSRHRQFMSGHAHRDSVRRDSGNRNSGPGHARRVPVRLSSSSSEWIGHSGSFGLTLPLFRERRLL